MLNTNWRTLHYLIIKCQLHQAMENHEFNFYRKMKSNLNYPHNQGPMGSWHNNENLSYSSRTAFLNLISLLTFDCPKKSRFSLMASIWRFCGWKTAFDGIFMGFVSCPDWRIRDGGILLKCTFIIERKGNGRSKQTDIMSNWQSNTCSQYNSQPVSWPFDQLVNWSARQSVS